MTENLTIEQRLENSNAHFRHKAAEVLGDKQSVKLLANIYSQKSVDASSLNLQGYELALAKLAAAFFIEIGADCVYVTDAGMRFIESLNREGDQNHVC